jgi:site-specific DNA-methyltransferase (adenine-specific)
MQIIEKNIKELIPYEKNPRKNDKSVDKVAQSIEQFGFRVPVVIDKDNVIVCGHTRYKAAQKLHLASIPCVVADDLTDEQIKAYRLADNKVSEDSEWDIDLLAEELNGIIDIDMSDFGFLDIEDDSDIEDAQEDNFTAEIPDEPKAKYGDIYQLGNHRLMCGDSTSVDDVKNLMVGGQVANIVFTDPPYGYNYQSNMREKSEKFDVIENDDKILDFFPNVKMFCNGFVFICTTWKVLDKWIPLFKRYFDLTNMIIWDKGGGGIGDLKHTFATDYEVILCASNGKEITGKRIGSVWAIDKDSANSYVHPTQKPVKLSELAIRNTTNKRDIVLDLFGGSGSTLIACEQLNRICYMMEYDPKYVDVIIKRWEDFTGKKAVLLNE